MAALRLTTDLPASGDHCLPVACGWAPKLTRLETQGHQEGKRCHDNGPAYHSKGSKRPPISPPAKGAGQGLEKSGCRRSSVRPAGGWTYPTIIADTGASTLPGATVASASCCTTCGGSAALTNLCLCGDGAWRRAPTPATARDANRAGQATESAPSIVDSRPKRKQGDQLIFSDSTPSGPGSWPAFPTHNRPANAVCTFVHACLCLDCDRGLTLA